MCLSLIATVLLFTFNVLLGLSGIAMLIIGIFLLVTPNELLDIFKEIDIPDYPELTEGFKIDGLIDVSSIFKGSSITLIVLGTAIFVLAVTGVCASLCGGLCRLMYCVLLGFVVVTVVGFIIFQSSREGKREFKLKVLLALNTTFVEYKKHVEDVDTYGNIQVTNESKAWFFYQTENFCCGVTNYSDYFGRVPPSCCQLKNQVSLPTNAENYTNYDNCIKNHSSSYLNVQGCLDAVYTEFMSGPHLGIILLAISLPFLVGCLVLSTYLMG